MNIAKRRAYYIAGFDQRGAGYYSSLYAKQIAEQSSRAGYQAEVSVQTPLNWSIQFKDNDSDQQTKTQYQFLSWEHILKPYTSISTIGFYAQSVLALIWYFRTGFMARAQDKKGFFFQTLLISYFGVLLPLLVATPLAILAALSVIPVLALVLATSLSLIGVWWLNKEFNCFWLVRAYNFNKRVSQNPDVLLPQLKEFAQALANDMIEHEADEYLLVGHCYGSALLIPLLSHLIPAIKTSGKRLSVLSLAQTSPTLFWTNNWYPKLVEALDFDEFDFVDYSSMADGVCFPDFYFNDEAQGAADTSYLTKSPRFHKLFSEEKYHTQVRKNKFRVHFQYLFASDKAHYYDFFYITSGPQKLIDYARSH